jgi:hypothetical protein
MPCNAPLHDFRYGGADNLISIRSNGNTLQDGALREQCIEVAVPRDRKSPASFKRRFSSFCASIAAKSRRDGRLVGSTAREVSLGTKPTRTIIFHVHAIPFPVKRRSYRIHFYQRARNAFSLHMVALQVCCPDGRAFRSVTAGFPSASILRLSFRQTSLGDMNISDPEYLIIMARLF